MDYTENYSNEDLIANRLIEYLKNGKLSTHNYRSTEMPFFASDLDTNNFTNNMVNNIDNIPDRLNRNMKIFYKLISSPGKEFYIGAWTFLSLDEAIEKFNAKVEDGQKNVFDIAFRYLGMGHIEVVSCDLESHLLFKRRDGGSNGYDREDNYKNVIENGSKNSEKFYFSSWFYNIEKGSAEF